MTGADVSADQAGLTGSNGLVTRDLSVRYGGVLANDGVSIDVRPGEIVGLIGPNGAGKTTFVDAVTGFTPCTGSVLLDGAVLESRSPHLRRRAGLSRTWQSGELFGTLTVVQNVTAAARPGGARAVLRDLFGRSSSALDDEVVSALQVVGLDGERDTLARNLSLGQQKLVGVARALVGMCEVVLLDEPAAGLDTQESALFADQVRKVAAGGPGVLLIDHDMSLVLGVCDRLYVMEFGKLIFEGTPSQARTDPAVVAAYLGSPVEASDD